MFFFLSNTANNMNAIFTQILHELQNQNQRNKMNIIEISKKEKDLFKFFLTIQNLEALENVFSEIKQFCETKKQFAIILDHLSNARFAIDDLKYLHEQKDDNGPYTNSYIDNFLNNEIETYEYDLEELEEKFSNLYRKS